MIKKNKKNLLRIPAVSNSRFLLALLKVVIHGKLSSSKLTMIGTLLKMIDNDAYRKDPEVLSLLKSIDISINCKLDDVKDNHLILSVIEASISNIDSTEVISGLIEPIITGSFTIQDQEILYVLEIVSMYSKVGFLFTYKDSIIDKFMNIESGSINGISTVVNDLEKEISELNVKLHKTLSTDGINASDSVSISDPDFLKNHFQTAYKMSKRKTKVLKTGIVRFNKFLSDAEGFLTGKMYIINGPINSFKTSLLLYIAKWIQLYNSDIYLEKFKINGKRPVVVIVSLENTWDENTERLFAMYSTKNMEEVTNLEAAEELWKANVYKTNSIIDICMIYGKAYRFSTSDLEYRIDELESQGFIVIATIIDYMKIMRDDLANTDPRLKLISISTDLHTLVTRKPEMVLITVHHINRDGDKALSEVDEKGGIDKVKSLGRQHLTEANSVEEACDFTMYIAQETSPYTGELYLTLKKGKCRYKRSEVEYFAHQLHNRFNLKDDIGLEQSLSINSIAETAGKDDNIGPVYGSKNGNKGKFSIRENNESSKNSNVFSSVFNAESN